MILVDLEFRLILTNVGLSFWVVRGEGLSDPPPPGVWLQSESDMGAESGGGTGDATPRGEMNGGRPPRNYDT